MVMVRLLNPNEQIFKTKNQHQIKLAEEGLKGFKTD